MNIARFPAIAVLAVALTMLAACGGGGDDVKQTDALASSAAGSNDASPVVAAETTYDVTYKDETKVMEGDAMDGFVSISDDGKTARFDDASQEIRDLKKGDVVILAGQAMGKVNSINTDPDNNVVIQLDEATLGEAIEDGQIGFSYPINWAELPEEYYSEPDEVVGLNWSRQEQSGIKFSGTIKGWEVEFELKPAADRLNMNVSAKMGSNVAVSGEGWINNYMQETLINYDQSELGEVSTKSIGLESEMELKWAAFGQGTAGLTEITSFSIPVGLTIPVQVGVVTIELRLKAVVQVVPELRVEGASSGGSWKVHYTSDQGFVVDDTLSSPFGSLKSKEIGVSGETVSAGFGVVAFALGIEFPRVEIGIFGSTAMAFITVKTYSTSEWTPGTTLTSDIPPCQKGSTTIQAIAGYKFDVLGVIGIEGTTPIWKDFFEKFKDDNPCTLTGE